MRSTLLALPVLAFLTGAVLTFPAGPRAAGCDGCIDSIQHTGSHTGNTVCGLSLVWVTSSTNGHCDVAMGMFSEFDECLVWASLQLVSCCDASGSYQCGTNPPTPFGPIQSCGSPTTIVSFSMVPIACGVSITCKASAETASPDPIEEDMRQIEFTCSGCSF